MQTLPAFTGEGDVGIPKYIVDELIHSGLFEAAVIAGFTAELGGSTYFLDKEV